MTSHLLEEALKHAPSHQALVNAVSKRVKQLNQGDRPFVEAGIRVGYADIALMEIIQGRLKIEVPATEPLAAV